MVVKKAVDGAQTFIVTLPEKVEDLILTVNASAEPPYEPGRHIFWLRAREVGEETWGQTIWAEMEPHMGDLFLSKEIQPGSLWLVPKTTYEIEVAPETLKVSEFGLEICEKKKEERVEAEVSKDSVWDSPVLWIGILMVMFVMVLGWMMRGQ